MFEIFIHSLFMGLIALFPVINPVGSALIVNPYLHALPGNEKRLAAGKIAVYSFVLCTVTLIAGQYILKLFGLSVPVIQLGGGIMICKMGWDFLGREKQEDQSKKEEIDHLHGPLEEKLFYPITFPVTTGAGTISVLLTLSAHTQGADLDLRLVTLAAIFLSVILMCMLIYFFYLNTALVMDFLGKKGEVVINQISAFLVFCVGLQIAMTGLKVLLKW